MAFPRHMLTERELECITTVFRSFETGLRGATIQPSVRFSKQFHTFYLFLYCRTCTQQWRCWAWTQLNRRLWIFQTILPSKRILTLWHCDPISSCISRKGLIYFPDFCQLVLKRFRNSEEQEENFKQNMFKVWTKSVHLDIYINSIVLSFIWKNMIIVFGQESFQLGLIYMSF